MSASDLSLTASHPTISNEISSDATQESIEDPSKNMDVEMTSQLTSMDGISTESSTLNSIRSEEMNPFQSTHQQKGRANGSRSGMPPPAGNPFNNAPWRREHAASIGAGSTGHDVAPLENIVNRDRSQSMMSVEGTVSLSLVKPGPVWPTENQLKVAYAYAIRREDGSYTRLIPADELNRISSGRIPVVQGPEGLIILPPPQQVHPDQRMGPEQMVAISVSHGLQTACDNQSNF
jgi:hypothetical protein